MSRDYGIVLLFDDNTNISIERLNKKCRAQVKNSSTTLNLPHLSLFQLRVHNDQVNELVDTLRNAIRRYPDLTFRMNAKLNLFETNVFWRSDEAKIKLRSLHQHIVHIAKNYRSRTDDFSQLTASDKIDHAIDINEYGIYWNLPHNFTPHITLLYGLEPHANSRESIEHISCNQHLCVSKCLALVELGKNGEATQIVKVIQNFDIPSINSAMLIQEQFTAIKTV